jgi:hypothetical protein
MELVGSVSGIYVMPWSSSLVTGWIALNSINEWRLLPAWLCYANCKQMEAASALYLQSRLTWVSYTGTKREGRLRCMCVVPSYARRISHGRNQDIQICFMCISYTHTNVEHHKYHMILGSCFVTTHDMSIQSFKNEMQYYLRSIIRVVTFIMDQREY